METQSLVDLEKKNKIYILDLPGWQFHHRAAEALRYWPPNIITDRKCIKNYTLPPASESGKPYEMKVGDSLSFAIQAIHHNSEYYDQPEVFDPERFSEENKGSIRPYSYLPFGLGPRNCIGSRFALLEVKAIIFHMMARFDFVVTPKTQIPLQLAKNNFVMQSEKGFWIGLKLRSKE